VRTLPPRRGVALLMAMVILTIVATIAAGMVWQQNRSVQIEAAERARTQAAWILNGAIDWARLILREDFRADRERGRGSSPRPFFDALGETWAQPLAEARLSSFLAADKDNTADATLELFLSGEIVDVQARYNLRNLFDPAGKPIAAERAALQRIADLAGAPGDTAERVVQALAAAWRPASEEQARTAPLPPTRIEELRFAGIEPAVVERLAPYVTLLPQRTWVNVNTAGAEVLAAAIDGLDLGTAERIISARKRKALGAIDSVEELQALLPPSVKPDPARVGFMTNWFEVRGRLRLEERVLEERSLVERRENDVTVRRRERLSQAGTR
jgi:general secretion pathway protein K